MRRAAAVPIVLLALAACGKPATAPGVSARPAARAGNGLSVLLITIDTLRADHLGAYGYRRPTSPRIDALARQGALFEQAYTFWPKTRGSFIMIMTGRRPSQNGYSKSHPMVLGFNPTLASTLKDAGYETAAVVDNPNVAAQHGYAKGFDRYRETWDKKEGLATETDRARAITEDARKFLARPPAGPFFLWLHYVNPHAPYTPPAPFDTLFVDEGARSGPPLAAVKGYHGGVREEWARPGKNLGYYVAQYDGEIAAVDQEVGRVLDALDGSTARANTMVVLTSDHGESLGEHDYYFDHGEDLFDPCLRIPLVIRLPGAAASVRAKALASTLDLVPTILDAVKVSYPPDLAGRSLLAETLGRNGAVPTHLFAQNERNLSAAFDERYKLVATPEGEAMTMALYDRASDAAERREAAASARETRRVMTRDLELFFERSEKEWSATRRLTEGQRGPQRIAPEVCDQLKSLGYLNTAGCD